MNAGAQLEKGVALIDEQVAFALRTTYKFRERWRGEKLDFRRRAGGFATLIQPSREQVEYDFFKTSVEFSVRNNMVNSILRSLFDFFGIDASLPKGPVFTWPNNKRVRGTLG